MTFPVRPIADNVFIALEPYQDAPDTGREGLVVVRSEQTKKRGVRAARVLASGPGYLTKQGVFIPNETRVGDRVAVSALAGQDWSLDFDAPRSNANAEHPDAASFAVLGGRSDVRCVREDEILCVLDDAAAVG